MKYRVRREDGAEVELEYGDDRPAGYAVTVPGDPGVVTQVRCRRDVLAGAFEMAADAAATLAAECTRSLT